MLGAGWVATDRHIPSLTRHDGAHLVAVYDHTIERAVAAAVPGAHATDDLDELLSLDLDAVFVCTPPWSHAELSIRALERGSHVFCEKPMAMDVAEARAMVEAAEAADRLLCVSHNFLWSTSMRRARAALARAGDLRYVSATQWSSDARRLPTWADRLPGGLLFDELPHMIYVVEDLLGSPLVVDDVRAAWGGRVSEPQSCEVRLTGRDAAAQLVVVFGAPISEWHVTSVAERSVVDVDLFRDVMISSGSDGGHTATEVLAASTRAAAQHFVGFASSGVRQARGRQFWGHDALIGEFLEAIVSGGVSPVPPRQALAVMSNVAEVVGAIGPRRR